MNKKIYTFLALIALFITSCYKDDSSLNYRLVNPIVIDMGGAPTSYSVFALDTLEIKPIVYKEGIKDTNLSYRWILEGNLIKPTLLDTTMTLKKCIDVRPEGNAYKLIYEVKDKSCGIIQEEIFDLTVKSQFGSGIVVCDTRDNQTSDVSLIMAYNFTASYSKDKDTVMRNLYSRINKRKIGGVATSVKSTIYGINRSLTIGSDRTIDRVDPFDYSYIDGNGSMFIIDPKNYNVETIGYEPNSGYELLSINGKIYPRGMQQNNKVYSYFLLTNDLSDYYMGIFYRPEWENGLGFDEKNGRILEFDMASRLKIFDSGKLAPDAPFDHNKLQKFTCRAMFSGDNKKMHTILQEKDPATGKGVGPIYSYVTKRVAWYDANAKDNGKPLYIINFNNLPEISNARFFNGTENQDVIYYATDKKIYSVITASPNNPTANLEYEVPAGDEITSMMAWKTYQGLIDYTNPNPAAEVKTLTVSSNNRMLVLTTYNGSTKEGKVITIAISALGTGALEKNPAHHGLFRGFGKITAINVQSAFK